jgi:putative Holliday junction resolvase
MKYLGIDYGSKRVGIAVSDDKGMIAFPRGTVENNERLISSLMKMAEAEHVERIVVGDTRALNGAQNPVTEEAEQFIAKLARTSGLPATGVFEAWSSIEASRYAPAGQEHNDAAAAAVILQRFLDMHPIT